MPSVADENSVCRAQVRLTLGQVWAQTGSRTEVIPDRSACTSLV